MSGGHGSSAGGGSSSGGGFSAGKVIAIVGAVCVLGIGIRYLIHNSNHSVATTENTTATTTSNAVGFNAVIISTEPTSVDIPLDHCIIRTKNKYSVRVVSTDGPKTDAHEIKYVSITGAKVELGLAFYPMTSPKCNTVN